ncbi:Uncharacterised protein [Mycobacterium tuberculosis]|uniref:Uncharacterized protein n=1 Tax=Mycobacterium tuberculosis TaxID=1773 RepID=A0A654TF77_MYCTX|nr:Uncharacterised protein [Mycobacterium tuberculosis]
MDSVGALLEPDRRGQRDLGQHRRGSRLGGMRGGQTTERGAQSNTTLGERFPHGGPVHGVRMRLQQSGDVVPRRRAVIFGGAQRRGGMPGGFTVPVGLHGEVDDTRRVDRCDGVDRGLLVEQQHLLKGDVANLSRFAEDLSGRSQSHLAVGGAGKGGNVMHLMIAEPGQHRGANVALPDVALRFLSQPHMRAKQRMHGDGAGTLCPLFLPIIVDE